MPLTENVDLDVAIVGAGLVGLAVAADLSRRKPDLTIALFERHPSFGQETSSRHSEVVHAGIYYPPASFKAELCRRGRELLYDFCEKYAVPFNRCGKFIVATSASQVGVLDRIRTNAAENGVDLVRLSRGVAQSRLSNPNIFEALWSPMSGIADSHAVMNCLLSHAEASGCLQQFSCEVDGVVDVGNRVSFTASSVRDRFQVNAKVFINCGGLGAAHIHRMFNPDSGLSIKPCRGRYFFLSSSWSGRFKELIYPVPDPSGGLGIHLTFDLAGEARLGPDVDWAFQDATPDDWSLYAFGNENVSLGDSFWESGRQIIPGLQREDLRPGYVGVRPKLFEGGQPYGDFLIKCYGSDARHIHVMGVESPGFTSCLAIAEKVGKMV